MLNTKDARFANSFVLLHANLLKKQKNKYKFDVLKEKYPIAILIQSKTSESEHDALKAFFKTTWNVEEHVLALFLMISDGKIKEYSDSETINLFLQNKSGKKYGGKDKLEKIAIKSLKRRNGTIKSSRFV